MAIESALYTVLTGNAGVAALIGTRLYPNVIPQAAALPAAAYQVITTGRNYNHSGQSSIATPRIQITIAALGSSKSSYDSAKLVAAAIRSALSGYRGTVGSVQIGAAFIDNEFDGYNLETDITTIRQDYTIVWKEV